MDVLALVEVLWGILAGGVFDDKDSGAVGREVVCPVFVGATDDGGIGAGEVEGVVSDGVVDPLVELGVSESVGDGEVAEADLDESHKLASPMDHWRL